MNMPHASVNLTNHFLIAMPGMSDPFFSRTVTYMCQHGDEGALGIIVNRPIKLTLQDVMEQMSIDPGDSALGQAPVYFGGPVHSDRGFVLHEPTEEWSSTLKISDTMALTTSRDILEAMGRGEGPRHALVALGYAGWSKGQLEEEIIQNAWLNAEAEQSIVFDLPAENRWKAAAGLMGVDISQLTSQAGHG
jgi:putative transcriptional regulator